MAVPASNPACQVSGSIGGEMKKHKRVVVVSDFHSGHIVGLTPPGWDAETEHAQLQKAYSMRRHIFDFYAKTLKELQPIDIVIADGDLIEGKNEKQGGTELIEADRLQQADMAAECILLAKAKTVLIAYGTGYHTGRDEDVEVAVAKATNALKIGSRDDIDVSGTIINYRHFISGSQVPHGRYTALAREQLWNTLWGERGEYPKADIILRAHVHYHGYIGAPGWLAMTLPALQGYGSKYGARIMSGIVDIGLVHFDIYGRNEYDWMPHLCRLPKTEAMQL